MKIYQFIQELKIWRQERNLTEENQRKGVLPNILEELGEFGEAIRSNNTEGKIDALLDCLVFLTNAYSSYVDEIDELKDPSYVDKYTYNEIQEHMFIFNIGELMLYCNDDEFSDLYKYLVGNIKSYCELKGYSFDICLDEVVKALNSRKGKWDDSIKKFVKENFDRYEPNYLNAKIKG